jgi:hypothetical protein
VVVAGKETVQKRRRLLTDGNLMIMPTVSISDLENQYGDPKKIGRHPAPRAASFGAGGEFGVGGKLVTMESI